MMQSEKLLLPRQDEEFFKAFASKNNMIRNFRTEVLQRQNNEHFNIEESKTKSEVKAQEEEYYDFRRLNEERLTRFIKDKLNYTFPNEMENIQKIKETNYILQKNSSKIDPKRENEEDTSEVPHPFFDKGDLYNEDFIESYSIVRDPAVNKLLDEVPIYRELAPIGREISCAR